MSEIDSERYADRLQGIRLDQRLTQSRDEQGNHARFTGDYCDDFHIPVDLEARRERELTDRKSLARRIGIAITQMERICPPKESAA